MHTRRLWLPPSDDTSFALWISANSSLLHSSLPLTPMSESLQRALLQLFRCYRLFLSSSVDCLGVELKSFVNKATSSANDLVDLATSVFEYKSAYREERTYLFGFDDVTEPERKGLDSDAAGIYTSSQYMQHSSWTGEVVAKAAGPISLRRWPPRWIKDLRFSCSGCPEQCAPGFTWRVMVSESLLSEASRTFD